MNTSWNRARLLITTAWVGSLWTVGYLVAPTLFKTLADTTLAGTIAGQLFLVEAWFSVICALMLIVISLYQRQNFPKLVLGMLVCTLIGYFALHPFMANLRAIGLSNPDAKWQFGVLHGISSGIYLMQSVLGAMLVLSGLEGKPTQAASIKQP
jgi:hypothetical protein